MWPVAVSVCLPFILKYQECFSSTLKCPGLKDKWLPQLWGPGGGTHHPVTESLGFPRGNRRMA